MTNDNIPITMDIAFSEFTPVTSYATAEMKLSTSPILPISLNIPMESQFPVKN